MKQIQFNNSTDIIADIKQIIEQAKKPTYVSINSFMIKSYWLVGRRIVEEKQGGKTQRFGTRECQISHGHIIVNYF